MGGVVAKLVQKFDPDSSCSKNFPVFTVKSHRPCFIDHEKFEFRVIVSIKASIAKNYKKYI